MLGNLITSKRVAFMARRAFECQRCGTCCLGTGGIYLLPEEIAPAARLLDVSSERFIQLYCEKKTDRLEVVCDEKGVCALMGPQGCLIHQAKPAICRLWPYFPGILKDAGALEEAKLACPGIDPQISHADFIKSFQDRNKNQT